MCECSGKCAEKKNEQECCEVPQLRAPVYTYVRIGIGILAIVAFTALMVYLWAQAAI